MVEALPALLRYASSLAFGARLHTRSLDRIVSGLLASRGEFGTLGEDATEVLRGPELDDAARRELQIRRFRKQAKLAARAPHYRRLFAELEVHPAKLSWPDVESLPPTAKDALRADPGAFVPERARPAALALTTGTTGVPTGVYFSHHELETASALWAVGLLLSRQVEPDDVVQLSVSSRGLVPTMLAARALGRIGAVVYQAGVVEPSHALALLARRCSLPRHKPQASILSTTPSYLGALVERGLELGYGPRDFGIERILLGGEIATRGLAERAERLLGPVEVVETYNATELLPVGALTCTEGHLHFPVPSALVEVLSLDGCRAAGPGEPGTLVVTPFAPYRETTVLLRYETGDVVRVPAERPTCELSTIPATSHVLGKLASTVTHAGGWTFHRDVVEALEALDDVPLPARFGLRPVEDGVGVEVVARSDGPRARRRIADRLERCAPLRELRVVTDAGSLERPMPLRADLREHSFADFGGLEPLRAGESLVTA